MPTFFFPIQTSRSNVTKMFHLRWSINFLFFSLISQLIKNKKKLNPKLFNRHRLHLLHLTVTLLRRTLDPPSSSVSSAIVVPQLCDNLSAPSKSVMTVSLSSAVDDLPRLRRCRRSPSALTSTISLSFVVSYYDHHQGVSYPQSSTVDYLKKKNLFKPLWKAFNQIGYVVYEVT